jgi:hypothetical protein
MGSIAGVFGQRMCEMLRIRPRSSKISDVFAIAHDFVGAAGDLLIPPSLNIVLGGGWPIKQRRGVFGASYYRRRRRDRSFRQYFVLKLLVVP